MSLCVIFVTRRNLLLYSDMSITQMYVFSLSWFIAFAGIDTVFNSYLMPLKLLALYLFTNLLHIYFYNSRLSLKRFVVNFGLFMLSILLVIVCCHVFIVVVFTLGPACIWMLNLINFDTTKLILNSELACK